MKDEMLNNPEQAIEELELETQLAKIKNTIVVISGKGGVGKSTTAANMAMSLALAGRSVGLLDVDFHGPSIPKLIGIEGRRIESSGNKLQPIKYLEKLKVMSLGLMLQSADDAVIWRGPMKMGVIKQLIKDVDWGKLDYLIIDCPPGTGDEPLSVVQVLKNPTGAVVVTQPQALSVSDVRRSIQFCVKLNLPVLGLIENMSGFVCPHCNTTVDIFKSGGGEELALQVNVPFLGKVPIDPQIVEASDEGKPFVYFYGKTETAKRFEEIVAKLIDTVESKSEEKQPEETEITENKSEEQEMSETSIQRIAVPTAAGNLCMHFGHCEVFTIVDYDWNNKKVLKVEQVTPPAHEPGLLPKWLHERDVNVVIAGGMGSRAQNLFTQNNIQVVTGAQPAKPEDVVVAFAGGNLETGDNACDH